MSFLTDTTRQPDHIQYYYPSVTPGDISFVEIFPPIGVARLGDSTKEYFLGPELPFDNDKRANLLPTDDARFRDSETKIRRQAARFRVYAYKENGEILGEIIAKDDYSLTWKVRVVNKKAEGDKINGGGKRNPDITDPGARKKLIVDSGEKTITRTNGTEVTPLNGTFQAKNTGIVPVNLGQLQVDDVGRLVFIAAKGGIFGTMPINADSLNNPECVDDVCDGWIDVAVSHNSQVIISNARHKAAVLSGSPKFPWDLRSTTTILDRIENVYESQTHERSNFYLNIWPVLEAAFLMSWVDPKAKEGHGEGTGGYFFRRRDDLGSNVHHKDLKKTIFGRLTNPNPNGGNPDMPDLAGGATAALTKLQYKNFDLWKEHKFDNSELKKFGTLEEAPLEDRPTYLTRANLEMTIGGSFRPGIEACDIVKDAATYDLTKSGLKPPYRVKFATIQPGALTVGLALPWQADFDHCGNQWWPAARPNHAKISQTGPFKEWNRGAKGADMLKNWKSLGFIIRPLLSAETRIESERTLPESD